MTEFLTWGFKSTGSPTNRTLPDRLADIVNVKDYNVQGDGVTDDSAAIQATFDAAFGTSGSPHGINASLNRAVYFPSGNYLCHGLTLTQVYGGRIFGAGQYTTLLTYNGPDVSGSTLAPVITTNGFAYSTIENMTVSNTGRINTKERVCIDLDWDNTGSVGLNNSALVNVGFGNTKYGVRVAESGNDGRGISFVGCTSGACWYAIKQNSDNALISVVGGGFSENYYAHWVNKGSACLSGEINAGVYFAAGSLTYPGQTDVLHNSTGTTTIIGFRSESSNVVYITQGKVSIIGTLHQQQGQNLSGTGRVAPTTIDGTGGEVTVNGCSIGVVGISNVGKISGAVNVSLRNVFWAFDEDHFASFTGTVSNWQTTTPLTFATLPSSPGDGLMMNISNAHTAAGAWGETVSGSGGTTVGSALVRWNAGTSHWTLVGK